MDRFFKRDFKGVEGLPAEVNPVKMKDKPESVILRGFSSAGRPSIFLKSRLKNLSKIKSSYFFYPPLNVPIFIHPLLNVPILDDPLLKYPILG